MLYFCPSPFVTVFQSELRFRRQKYELMILAPRPKRWPRMPTLQNRDRLRGVRRQDVSVSHAGGIAWCAGRMHRRVNVRSWLRSRTHVTCLHHLAVQVGGLNESRFFFFWPNGPGPARWPSQAVLDQCCYQRCGAAGRARG